MKPKRVTQTSMFLFLLAGLFLACSNPVNQDKGAADKSATLRVSLLADTAKNLISLAFAAANGDSYEIIVYQNSATTVAASTPVSVAAGSVPAATNLTVAPGSNYTVLVMAGYTETAWETAMSCSWARGRLRESRRPRTPPPRSR